MFGRPKNDPDGFIPNVQSIIFQLTIVTFQGDELQWTKDNLTASMQQNAPNDLKIGGVPLIDDKFYMRYPTSPDPGHWSYQAH